MSSFRSWKINTPISHTRGRCTLHSSKMIRCKLAISKWLSCCRRRIKLEAFTLNLLSLRLLCIFRLDWLIFILVSPLFTSLDFKWVISQAFLISSILEYWLDKNPVQGGVIIFVRSSHWIVFLELTFIHI